RPADQQTSRPADQQTSRPGARLMSHVSGRLPTYLYLLSTLMFAIVNLAHGYTGAGLIGVIVLFVIASAARPTVARSTRFPNVEHAEGSD
ncbi:MAG: hypothetical protein ABI901_07485, partial [Roseiflexaceae bacterium]